MRYSKFLTNLADAIVNADYVLDSFKAKFSTDPAHAFSWGTNAVQAAAARAVASGLQHSLWGGDNGPRMTFIQLKTWIDDEVSAKAKYPPQSTSPMSNLVDQYTLAAWAGWAAGLRYETALAWEPEETEEEAAAAKARAEAIMNSSTAPTANKPAWAQKVKREQKGGV